MITAEDDSSDALERVVRQSVLLSIDNAHGVHPNYADKHDEKHQPILDRGPVIKINANQRYASNSRSVAFFKSLCAELGVSCQSFVMRNDMACGSTIGPIIAADLGITTIDIGIATLGMH
jgi:aspartyl aminopeptidase